MFNKQAMIYLNRQQTVDPSALIDILQRRGFSLRDPQDGRIRALSPDGDEVILPEADLPSMLATPDWTLMLWVDDENYIYCSQGLEADPPYLSVSFDQCDERLRDLVAALLDFALATGPGAIAGLFVTIHGRTEFEARERYLRGERSVLESPPEIVFARPEVVRDLVLGDEAPWQRPLDGYILHAEPTAHDVLPEFAMRA
jgi:hypothetical protein